MASMLCLQLLYMYVYPEMSIVAEFKATIIIAFNRILKH